MKYVYVLIVSIMMTTVLWAAPPAKNAQPVPAEKSWFDAVKAKVSSEPDKKAPANTKKNPPVKSPVKPAAVPAKQGAPAKTVKPARPAVRPVPVARPVSKPIPPPPKIQNEIKDIPWETVGDGVRQKVYRAGSLCAIQTEITRKRLKNEDIVMHTHSYASIYYVVEGQIYVRKNEEERQLGPGRVFVIESGVPHGYRMLSRKVVLMDICREAADEEKIPAAPPYPINKCSAFVYNYFSWIENGEDAAVLLSHIDKGADMVFPDGTIYGQSNYALWLDDVLPTVRGHVFQLRDVSVSPVNGLYQITFFLKEKNLNQNDDITIPYEINCQLTVKISETGKVIIVRGKFIPEITSRKNRRTE